MKKSILQHKLISYLIFIKEWTLETPERSLNEAYQAALLIRSFENKHFNGEKITAECTNYGDSALAYFNSELKQHLNIIKLKLVQFSTIRLLINYSPIKASTLVGSTSTNTNQKLLTSKKLSNEAGYLEKLNFIDEVLANYKINNDTLSINSQVLPNEDKQDNITEKIIPTISKHSSTKKGSHVDEKSIVPKSIISTFNRIRLDYSPSTEQEIVKSFRLSRRKTQTSIKFIILLILVPVLTYHLSKHLIIEPVFNHFNLFESSIFINLQMESEALNEMQNFEQKLKFENFLAEQPTISAQFMETRMKERVHELVQEFRHESSNTIKNIFADILSAGAFS
jgi:hypothetical protein